MTSKMTSKNTATLLKSELELHQVAWIILNAVERLKVGKGKLALFLKGSKSKDVQPIANEGLYGGLIWYDIPTITGFIEQLEAMFLIQRKNLPGHPYNYSILCLTDDGRFVLEEKKRISLQISKLVKPITIGDSEKETYSLFKNGKSIEEIGEERGLAISTIYEHFYRLVLNNYISNSEIVSEEKIKKILNACEKFSTKPKLKEVKEMLPEDISYGEIKCVLADAEKINWSE